MTLGEFREETENLPDTAEIIAEIVCEECNHTTRHDYLTIYKTVNPNTKINEIYFGD